MGSFSLWCARGWMGGRGADLGRRKHLKAKNKIITQPTRPETAMTMMRVLLSLIAAIPMSKTFGRWDLVTGGRDRNQLVGYSNE